MEEKNLENKKSCLGIQLFKNLKNLSLNDSCLHFNSGDGNTKIVVPEKLRLELIRSYHEIDSSHAGTDKTFSMIKPYYFWPKMFYDVVNYIKTCHLCQLYKPKNQKSKAPHKPIHPYSKLSEWQTDILGQLPSSTKGNKYIFLFIDRSSKLVEAFACNDIKSEKVINGYPN